MGASGAGKTTLLDVIALRKTKGKITGKSYLNGIELNKKTLYEVSGYVEQQDTLPIYETIYEALMFSAVNRLDSKLDGRTIKNFVEDTIKVLYYKYILYSY